jgi:hypothetical protein
MYNPSRKLNYIFNDEYDLMKRTDIEVAVYRSEAADVHYSLSLKAIRMLVFTPNNVTTGQLTSYFAKRLGNQCSDTTVITYNFDWPPEAVFVR